MRGLGRVLVAAGVGAFIAAVWAPQFMWQFFFTGALLVACGAAILGGTGSGDEL